MDVATIVTALALLVLIVPPAFLLGLAAHGAARALRRRFQPQPTWPRATAGWLAPEDSPATGWTARTTVEPVAEPPAPEEPPAPRRRGPSLAPAAARAEREHLESTPT